MLNRLIICCTICLSILALRGVAVTIPSSSQRHHSLLPRANTAKTCPNANSGKRTTGRDWNGWKGVEKIFSFGDSYTSTGFDENGAQPSPSNPFGNPDPNAVPVKTITGGLTWVQYLTIKYNQSFIETFNFAAAGATISNNVLGIDGDNDFEHQISNHFQPIYATSNGSSNWTATNSLFTMYFGINDVAHTWRQHNGTTSDLVFASYRSSIDKLYTLGARNFLIHNVPPFNRGPSQAALGRAAQQDQGTTINDYNYRINVLSDNFINTHPDASLLTFQTNQLFTNILSEGVDCYEQSQGLKNLTQSCEAYNKGNLPEVDYFNASCGVRLSEYFWLDGLHPTYTVNDALAGAVAKALG